MATDRIRIYSTEELERIAALYLEERFGQHVSIPVDVDLLVEKSEGIDIDIWPKLRTNHRIEGGVWVEPATGKLSIYIADELSDNDAPHERARYRTTVAEELAHIHLHKPLISRIKSLDDFKALHNHPQWADVERNAKKFAALILMPTKSLMAEAREIYAQIVGRPEIRREWARRHADLRNWVDPVKKWLHAEMVRRFEVSRRAMEIRLDEPPAQVNRHVEEAIKNGLDSLL